MGVFDGEYPEDLSRVIGHAKRLMKLLAKLERARRDRWFVGRATEVRGVVALAITDWRSGARDLELTGKNIGTYIDALHRGASKKLRCGLALECCSIDDVITAVAGDEALRSAVGIETTATLAPTHGTSAPTARQPWADSPEMLARVKEGEGLVEVCARVVVRTTGESYATMDDLRGFGREGLLDAARSFDERRGVPFERWASLRIRSAMIDGVRRSGPLPAKARRELQALTATDSMPNGSDTSESADSAAGSGNGDVRGTVGSDVERLGGHGPSPEDAMARAQLAALVREIVASLPGRERELVERSYFNGQTLEQAAAAMGVTRAWARRIHTRAMETMQRALRKREGIRVGAKGNRPPKERS